MRSLTRPRPDFSSELRLLLSVLTDQIVTSTAPERGSPDIDWEQFVEICNLHAVVPLVCRAMEARDWADFSHGVRSSLSRCVMTNRLRSTVQALEAVRITTLFEAGGVSAVTFKGPLLAQYIYGGVELRQFLDLDILVARGHFAGALSIILSAGYCATASKTEPEYLAESGQRAFRHKESGLLIDLHMKLSSFGRPFPFPEAELWKQKLELPLADGLVDTLSWDHLALFLAFHGTKERWRKLKWVCDFSMLHTARPELDWAILLATATRHHCGRMLLVAACLADTLGFPAPPLLVTAGYGSREVVQLVEDACRKLDRPNPESELSIYRYQIAIAERNLDKCRIVFRLLTTPNASDVAGIAVPPRLRWVYYLLRPFRVAAKVAGLLYRSRAAR